MPDLQTPPFTPTTPWIRAFLAQPNLIIRVPSNRVSKPSTEDSLFAETLQTSRTFPVCFIFYSAPSLPVSSSPSASTSNDEEEESSRIQEVHFLVRVGDGLNGHPAILHGGIVAALVDEGMGVLQTVNHERTHMLHLRQKKSPGSNGDDGGGGRVFEGSGDALSSLPPLGSFTAELKIRYRRPVSTPGEVLCTARYVRREGRKEWIEAVIRQGEVEGVGEGDGMVTCAVGEGLFIEPKKKDVKL